MSRIVDAADAKVLGLARSSVPSARISSVATRDGYSCFILVDTDAEKNLINGNAVLLEKMKEAASATLRRPVYVNAESQETVDRRWNGDWNYVFR